MKAKQKAIELVDKYRILLQETDTDISEEILLTIVAKDCAIVCVDEIMKYVSWVSKLDAETVEQSRANDEMFINFWLEVKQEISKI